MCTHVSAGTTSFVHDGCYFLSGELQISQAEHQLNNTPTHGHGEIGAMSCKQAWENWKKAGQGGGLPSYLEIGQAVRRGRDPSRGHDLDVVRLWSCAELISWNFWLDLPASLQQGRDEQWVSKNGAFRCQPLCGAPRGRPRALGPLRRTLAPAPAWGSSWAPCPPPAAACRHARPSATVRSRRTARAALESSLPPRPTAWHATPVTRIHQWRSPDTQSPDSALRCHSPWPGPSRIPPRPARW
jgi:hypothetical protein